MGRGQPVMLRAGRSWFLYQMAALAACFGLLCLPGVVAAQQPTPTKRVAVNLRAARALKLRIPQSILVRADEVIR